MTISRIEIEICVYAVLHTLAVLALVLLLSSCAAPGPSEPDYNAPESLDLGAEREIRDLCDRQPDSVWCDCVLRPEEHDDCEG
jgi:hypothetical protein